MTFGISKSGTKHKSSVQLSLSSQMRPGRDTQTGPVSVSSQIFGSQPLLKQSFVVQLHPGFSGV